MSESKSIFCAYRNLSREILLRQEPDALMLPLIVPAYLAAVAFAGMIIGAKSKKKPAQATPNARARRLRRGAK